VTKNRFDTRNRGADEVFYDLRMMRADAKSSVVLAVFGSNSVDPRGLARALNAQWSAVVTLVGFQPQRVMTSCRDVGTEKAVRLAAKDVTGKLAVIVHRAEMTYGIKQADEMCCNLVSREADALLMIGGGSKFLRDRFAGWYKPIHEVDF
jgi:hypothetical protein